jgi:hypothetical protein
MFPGVSWKQGEEAKEKSELLRPASSRKSLGKEAFLRIQAFR